MYLVAFRPAARYGARWTAKNGPSLVAAKWSYFLPFGAAIRPSR